MMSTRLYTLLRPLLGVIVLQFFTIPLSFAAETYATQTGDTVNVTIHGTLKRKPCYINNDGIIAIDFGNVGVNKIDGKNYIKTIDYTLECEDPDETANLKMTLAGTQTTYDKGAITTSVDGLGIELLQNGTAVVINQSFVIDYNKPPVLQAVPVTSGASLSEGAFTATATLLAEYE
ncbi:fimbrial protein [Pantoea sp. C2G6]|uniref:fimbrial protein n=1 Tax=Pantoea sp. C2G6 TaxID=3243084 RepID=UPI003ED9BCE9